MTHADTGRSRADAAQDASAACMVRPAAFAFNPQTAATNHLQVPGAEPQVETCAARREFDGMVEALRRHGVRLCVVEDTPTPAKPDAVFPNNWVSFHADGTVVLYPMLSPNRRAERRPEVIAAVCNELGFVERRRVDLTGFEAQGRYLEGTGSLVIDHPGRVVYANRSPRTDASLVTQWADLMGYTAVIFDAATPDGMSVYHTNVLMWIGTAAAGIGIDWIAPADRDRVRGALQASGRHIVELPASSLSHFAGNMLEMACERAGRLSRVLILSAAAAGALGEATLEELREASGELLCVAIPTIERLGGGSVRCMLAEVPV